MVHCYDSDQDITNAISSMIRLYGMSEGKTVFRRGIGNIVDKNVVKLVKKEAIEAGFFKYYDNKDYEIYLHDDHGYIDFNVSSYDKHFIGLFGFNEKFILDIYNKYKDKSVITKKNVIKMLTHGTAGFYVEDAGEINRPLIRENYSSNLLEKYDFIGKQLVSDDPVGRLVILNGDPGTGKSYFIRGLVTEVEASYIYVPNSLAGRLSDPDLMTALIEHKTSLSEELRRIPRVARPRREDAVNADSSNVPVVLIIEDADSCLEDRKKAGNSSKINDLLNFSDGILGELANIRIVASTNLKNKSFDEAVLRPGRLCANIEFPLLSPAQASQIYKNLTGKEKEYTKEVSLAQVYGDRSDEYKDKIEPTKKEKPGQYV